METFFVSHGGVGERLFFDSRHRNSMSIAVCRHCGIRGIASFRKESIVCTIRIH